MALSLAERRPTILRRTVRLRGSNEPFGGLLFWQFGRKTSYFIDKRLPIRRPSTPLGRCFANLQTVPLINAYFPLVGNLRLELYCLLGWTTQDPFYWTVLWNQGSTTPWSARCSCSVAIRSTFMYGSLMDGRTRRRKIIWHRVVKFQSPR